MWLQWFLVVCTIHRFQSTHPRRVWLYLIIQSIHIVLFQSTHPRRVWPLFAPNWDVPNYVSIHTPTQGVTYARNILKYCKMFQSTHPRRVWQKALSVWCSQNGFNPHTHAGCDLKNCQIWPKVSVSIHTPTQGVTQTQTSHINFIPVSIHTPTQGVTNKQR